MSNLKLARHDQYSASVQQQPWKKLQHYCQQSVVTFMGLLGLGRRAQKLANNRQAPCHHSLLVSSLVVLAGQTLLTVMRFLGAITARSPKGKAVSPKKKEEATKLALVLILAQCSINS
jgi:hypothetical protein